MKVGDMVVIHESTRRNGRHAGKLALIIGIGDYSDYVLSVDGEIQKFHQTQIAGLINESR